MVKWDMALAVRIFFIATLVGLVAVALQYWHVLRNALSDSQWLPTAYFRTSGSNYDGLSPTLKLSAWLAENVSDDASPVEIETAVNKSLFWGTYRPNLYFGTRTRNADAVLTGLAWHGLTVPEDLNQIRHGCDQNHHLETYGWLEHDGRNYGKQEIVDQHNGVKLTTEFLKRPGGGHGGEWAARISGSPSSNAATGRTISLYYYLTLSAEGNARIETESIDGRNLRVVVGETKELGKFKFYLSSDQKQAEPRYLGVQLQPKDIWRAHDVIGYSITNSFVEKSKNMELEVDLKEATHLPDIVQPGSNVFIFQVQTKTAFQMDLAFLSESAHEGSITPQHVQDATGETLTRRLQAASISFDQRFEETFRLKSKGFKKSEINFAKAAMSNLVGGMGYFHGDYIVDRGEVNEETGLVKVSAERQEGPASLFTAVPSRPFFPRGFLWDEGFHQLLIGAWDNDLSLDALKHWVALIDETGWVGREQILGEEARSKVPREFQTQYPHYANPPFLLASLNSYLERLSASQASETDLGLNSVLLQNKQIAKNYLATVYAKFSLQYKWFVKSQTGSVAKWGRKSRGGEEAYRWRGRTPNHCLTSGLDDYPRAAEPHPGELHVDLISWVGFMSQTLGRVAEQLELPEEVSEYAEKLKNVKYSLKDLHWNPESNSFCDLTFDTIAEESIFVVHKGYISLFPVLFGLVEPDSDMLKHTLELIRNDEELWTPFGVASLSQSDELFGTGEDYWRGAIWININYLVLSSLDKNYINVEGPHQQLAKSIYNELRQNLIKNIHAEYVRTKYLWEQYSPLDGNGQRSHPFTGWTSLIVLIMAEIY